MHITVQSDGAIRESRRIGVAFCAALVLHAGTLAAVTLWRMSDVQSAPGEQEVTIDLAPAMDLAEALSSVEATSPAGVWDEVEMAQPPEPAETVQEIDEVQPQEAVELKQPENVAETLPAEAEDALPIAPPQEVVAATVVEEKPAPKPVPRKVERKTLPAPRKAVAERNVAPSARSQGQNSSSRENTGGAAASADPNALNRYAAQLAATLRRRLRYPESARAQGISGVATVRFTMHRSGRIISATLVRGTGYDILDQAAVAAAAPGTELPPAPDSITQPQLTFAVPLRFNLR